jgi:glycosyltransferase involved in cell wall biosynthesis
MASGVPVVASDLPPVRELMRDGEHGRLVPADRPGELARAIRVLLDDPERLTEMGRAGRAHVAAELSWERSTSRLREVYAARNGKPDLIPRVGSVVA